jgi:hypothetical protein
MLCVAYADNVKVTRSRAHSIIHELSSGVATAFVNAPLCSDEELPDCVP